MITILEKVDLLHNAEIFYEIRTRSLARIAAISQEVRFEPGQVIFGENEAADALFILLQGEATLSLSGKGARKSARLQAVGAMAVLAEQAHMESARAVEPVLALRIGQSDLFDAMAEDINITRGIMRALIRLMSESH